MNKKPEYIYFKLVKSGVADNYDIIKVAKIVSGKDIYPNDFESVRNYADCCIGIEKELKNPSVEELLTYGEEVKAVRKYREEHDTTLTEAKLVVRQMEKNLKNKTKE